MVNLKSKISLGKKGFLRGVVAYSTIYLSSFLIIYLKGYQKDSFGSILGDANPTLGALAGPFSIINIPIAFLFDSLFHSEEILRILMILTNLILGMLGWGIIGMLANYYMAINCTAKSPNFKEWIKCLTKQLRNRPDGVKLFWASGIFINFVIFLLTYKLLYLVGPYAVYFFGPSSFFWELTIMLTDSPNISIWPFIVLFFTLQSLLLSLVVEFIRNFIKN